MPIKNQIMQDIAKDIIAGIKQSIRTLDISFTGALENSFEAEQDGEDVVVGSRLKYADIVEFGRTPGSMPPVKVLFPWVLQKIGGLDEKEVQRIAFAVAKKIEEKGTEPQRYIRATLHKMAVNSQ